MVQAVEITSVLHPPPVDASALDDLPYAAGLDALLLADGVGHSHADDLDAIPSQSIEDAGEHFLGPSDAEHEVTTEISEGLLQVPQRLSEESDPVGTALPEVPKRRPRLWVRTRRFGVTEKAADFDRERAEDVQWQQVCVLRLRYEREQRVVVKTEVAAE